jgi:hypothetical protein
MRARTLTSMLLSTALVLSVNGIASAAPGPSDTNRASNLPESSQRSLIHNYNSLSFKTTIPGVSEVAEVYYADTCYTFAGPTCRMRDLVWEGAPCRCYFTDGWLAGQAW